MNKIEKLPELLKNQIKAGEVITRPKDVVKEIMENALDAGANKLILQVKEGGLVSISLQDNGGGIPKEQLVLALTAHATSKLKALEDLNAIDTMGFRGEALASIVSVSRVSLASNTKNQDNGWEIKASQDQFDEQGIKPSAIVSGTRIEIRDLFFNARARREFLSSVNAETAQIDEVVRKIAMSRPDVEIQYQTDRKTMNIPASEKVENIERLKAILGEGFAKHALWLSAEKDGINIYGFVTDPQYQRAKADKQYLFINKRAVKDPGLQSAVRRAYQDVMYQKNQPGFVIYIDTDPQGVDVNIHPTKEKVRIKDSRPMTSLLYRTVSQKLVSLRPSIQPTTPYIAQESAEMFDSMPSVPLRSMPQERVSLQSTETLVVDTPMVKEYPLGHALAQLQGVYILSQAKDGLIVVDMHAAHERILYEKLKVAYQKEGVAKQNLMVPVPCELTDEQINASQETSDVLSQVGFDISFASGNTALIRAMPKVVSSNEASVLLQKVLNALLEQEENKPVEIVVHALLSLIACHQAIRANRQLSLLEMNQLLREIEEVSHGSQCNHGRPTWLHWTMHDLDGFFHRGQ